MVDGRQVDVAGAEGSKGRASDAKHRIRTSSAFGRLWMRTTLWLCRLIHSMNDN